MMEVKTEGPRVRVGWDYDQGHRVIAATGISGGLTPGGHLRACFYNELGVMPDQQKDVVIQEEDGKNVERPVYGPEVMVTRNIGVTILVPTSQLRSFANWFKDQADEFDKQFNEARRQVLRRLDRGKEQDASSL